MISSNENIDTKTSTINFDALCEDFNGQSFYGIEFILEDFFQTECMQPVPQAIKAIDFYEL